MKNNNTVSVSFMLLGILFCVCLVAANLLETKVVQIWKITATAGLVALEKDGKSCDMRKLMALMGMGVKQGETVTIKVEGDDEEAAAEAIQKFLSENV